MSIAIHATAHVNVHVAANRPVRSNAPVVRDHREDARRPIVLDRDHDRDRDQHRYRDNGRDHDRDRDRFRPVIVRPAPVVIAPTYTSWTPAPSYTYQPASIQLLWPTSLASDQLSISTGSLGSATALELDASGTGSTYVSQLVVYAADGSYQVLNVNAVLSPNNPTVQVPLDNCAGVTRIVIDGHSDWGGQLAMRAI